MEVVLVRYVGAGLALALSSLDSRVPRETITGGLELIAELARERPAGLAQLIDRAVRDICGTWRALDVPDEVANQHLEALPALFERHADLAGDWAASLAAQGAGSASGPSKELSNNLVAASLADGTLQRSGLHVPVCLALTERLLSVMAASVGEIEALVPAVETVFPGLSDAPEPPLQATLARLAPALCSRALLESLIAADRASGCSDGEIEAGIEGRACACQELMGELKSLIGRVGDGDEKRYLGAIAAKLEGGDLGGAEGLLAGLEEAPNLEGDAAGDELAGDLRRLRGRLDEIRGRWEAAARHYAAARRDRPSYDVKGRWQLLMRQAAALSRHGTHSGDVKALFEAAQLHAEAGGLLQEQDAPMEWATAHVDLGNLLLNLASRESRPERYLAAALHFKPAVDVFSRLGAMEDWALAQLGLAEALRGQGEFQGDPVTLADAAFAYRAALGILHSGRSPGEWLKAKSGLGETLVRIAEETGEAGLVEEAVAALKTVLAGMREADSRRVEAALGRAYVVLAAERDDVTLLEEAVQRIKDALGTDGSSVKPAAAATLERLLGSSLWALGEAEGDKTKLEAAAASLDSSRQRYAALGDADMAASIAKELANLELVLARLRHPLRRASDGLRRSTDGKRA